MGSNLLLYMAIGAGALFAIVIVFYLILRSKTKNIDLRNIAKLTKGTKEKAFTMEIFYQKFYTRIIRTPFLKRYALKVRRRLEIINIDDEYLTREQSAKIMFRGLMIVVVFTLVIVFVAKSNLMLLSILLLFELFMIETLLRRNGRFNRQQTIKTTSRIFFRNKACVS